MSALLLKRGASVAVVYFTTNKLMSNINSR